MNSVWPTQGQTGTSNPFLLRRRRWNRVTTEKEDAPDRFMPRYYFVREVQGMSTTLDNLRIDYGVRYLTHRRYCTPHLWTTTQLSNTSILPISHLRGYNGPGPVDHGNGGEPSDCSDPLRGGICSRVFRMIFRGLGSEQGIARPCQKPSNPATSPHPRGDGVEYQTDFVQPTNHADIPLCQPRQE